MFKLLKYIKPYRWALLLTTVLYAIKSLTDLYLPMLTADIVNIGVVDQDVNFIIRTGVIMLIVATFNILCLLGGTYISARTSNMLSRDLRESVFTRIESFSLDEFDKFGTASLITRSTNDINHIRMIMDLGLKMIIISPMTIIGSVFLAYLKDPLLSMIFVIIIPIVIVTFSFIFRKGMPLNKEIQNKLDSINLVLRESLTGIRVIRAFNREAYDKRRFETINNEYAESSVRVHRIMGIITPVVTLIMNIAIIAIVWFGGIRIDTGNIMVGDLMAFIQYALLVVNALTTVTRLMIMIPRVSVSAERVNEVLETTPSIMDPATEKDSNSQQGYVEFKNVTFSYPGAEIPTLTNISFSARPGDTTAIIGGTGSGKSTLVQLILRIYDVDEGSILVNGVDVRDIKQDTLRKKIGYVPQKNVLFSGTVNENIRHGKEDATQQEIEHAADIAQAAEFVKAMPAGFETDIAQGGINISGGQKQRISIARALVRQPEIFIFDDSFSALDFKTDAKLRQALKKETRDTTIFIVSQRVGTVMDADQIIVIEEANIVGIGTHSELVETCEVYKEIVSSQMGGEVTA